MTKNGIGVWIDQQNAFIVRPLDGDWEVVTLFSEMESHRKSTGGKAKSKPYMHESGPSSASHRNNAESNTMHQYIRNVAKYLSGTDRIFILGPGDTKLKLRNQLVENENLQHMREIALETSDRMTEPQLKAAVLSHFGQPAKRFMPGQTPHDLRS